MIFEVCEVSGDVKEDNEDEATIITTGEEIPEDSSVADDDEEDIDWETFNKVLQKTS